MALGGLLLWASGCAVSFDGYELKETSGGSAGQAGAGGSGASGGTGASAGQAGAGGSGASGGTGASAGASGSGGGTGATGGAGGASGGTGGTTGGTGGTTGGTGGTTGGTGGATGGTGGTGGTTGGTGGATGGTGGVLSCPSQPGVDNMALVVSPAGTFCVDWYEVTNARYDTFVKAGGYPAEPSGCSGNNTAANLAPKESGNCPIFKPQGEAKLPVSCVDWCDAYAYCKKVGKRLCGRIGGGSVPSGQLTNASESEWYQACSKNGTQQFPYGNFYSEKTCQGVDATAPERVQVDTLTSCEGGYPDLLHMSGNLREWEDGCVGGNCPERGGGYFDTQNPGSSNNLTCGSANMAPRTSVSHFRGFRCCADPVVL